MKFLWDCRAGWRGAFSYGSTGPAEALTLPPAEHCPEEYEIVKKRAAVVDCTGPWQL